jgi:hypothetical protein
MFVFTGAGSAKALPFTMRKGSDAARAVGKSSHYLDFQRATHNQQQRTNRLAHIVFETIRDRDCLNLVSSDDYELIYSIGEKNIGDELTSAGRPIKAYHAT